MTRHNFAPLLLLSLVGSAFAPVQAACVEPTGGIGGTGNSTAAEERGGIGGTGLGVPGAGGGIGGTGREADSLGVVGMITGFGSVCVSGVKVEFDAATRVEINRVAGDLAQLALGQVVAIEADTATARPVARTVQVIHELEGPITASAVAAGMIQVMRQPIRVDAETYLGGVEALNGLTSGRFVRVSGFRDASGEVVATRIDVADVASDASVIGPLRKDVASAGVTVAGLTVEFGGESAREEGDVLVRGRWDGQRLVDATRHDYPVRLLVERVRRVVVEGFVLSPPGVGSVRIGGIELDDELATAASAETLRLGARVVLSGHVDGDRRIVPARIEPSTRAIERTGGRGSADQRAVPRGPAAAAHDGAAQSTGGLNQTEENPPSGAPEPRDSDRPSDGRASQRGLGGAERIERPGRVERPERQGRQ
ncbi:MAG: DUF5666 domain-containing protein [Thiotrichales bacterium]